jgi:D-ribulokinase
MASEPVWVGIDLGTQSARALAVTVDGTVVGEGRAALRSRRDGVRHEQDPEDWWDAVGAATRAAMSQLQGVAARGVAICSTSGTVLLVDRRLRPLSRALMYDDARAAAQARAIAERGSLAVQPTWALPKLLWLLEAHGQDGRAMHAADFVGSRLAGHAVATDSSHALKTGYDAEAGDWPRSALEAVGVAVDRLPDVVAPGSRIGEVWTEASVHTGLPEGTPLVAGMTDGCAAQIAAGALAFGSCNSVLGTTLVLKAATERPLHDDDGAIYNHRHPDGGWLPGGSSNVGAGALDAAFPREAFAALEADAARFEGTETVVYPLVGAGERFPFVRPDAEPFELGTPSCDAERFAAILQGVAFVERLGLAYLEALGARIATTVTLTGGATRSRYWCQLRADVLDRTVRVPSNPEPALGMAMLAAADGGSVTETSERMRPRAEELDPRPDGWSRLERGYRQLIGELERRGYLGARLMAAA